MNPVHWAPRLTQARLRRLYRSDAAGLLDEELLDEVGHILYQRCRSILDVHSAKQGQVRCQACVERGLDTWIGRPKLPQEAWESYEVTLGAGGPELEAGWQAWLAEYQHYRLEYLGKNYGRVAVEEERRDV